MNGLVCGYGSDSDQEEDSTTSVTNRNDNGSVKSSAKGKYCLEKAVKVKAVKVTSILQITIHYVFVLY